ncbi:MAG TPA: hypothetical protein PKL31_14040 [Fulvivirga sp.]|nr:hypothetical protein [Fulvivirga sp.]
MKKLFGLTLTFLILFFTSCSEDEVVTNEPAPEIPPQETLVMPFESFDNSGGRIETHNAGTARLVIAFWQLASLPLVIPAVAFKASFTQTPTFVNGEWIWSYQFNAGGVSHSAALHGSIVSTGVKWEMYISKDGEFTDFLWFEGISQIDGLKGNWILYESPDKPAKVLDITWSRNIDGTVGDIRYTNIEGGYVNYGITDDATFDAFYNIKGNDGDLVEIKWNREKKNGQITTADGVTHCWDTSFEDIDC